MSYILDALKKSQAEKAADGVTLRVQERQQQRSFAPWLSAGLAIVLLVNAGLLLWIFVLDREPRTEVTDAAKQLAADVSAGPGAQQATTPQPGQASARAEEQRPKLQLPPAQKQPRLQPKQSITKVTLTDLPLTEQTLYNGFTYSTHIYTDDPSLCAIVVDGQRLTAGDSFKGLSVVAITEAGVIFEENRRGQRRQVEVSVLDQWDD